MKIGLDLVHGPDEFDGLPVADYFDPRVGMNNRCQGPGMVRLHVIDYQKIKASSVQDLANFFQVSAQLAELDRVDQRGPLIHNKVGIVGNAFGQGPDIFKRWVSRSLTPT